MVSDVNKQFNSRLGINTYDSIKYQKFVNALKSFPTLTPTP